MTAKDFDPAHVNVEAFAKNGASSSGEWPLAMLKRLSAATVDPANAAPVAWSATGELRPARGAAPQVWLHIEAGTRVRLECQRCLKPVEAGVRAKRSFLFVEGEARAAALDADYDDDVLALTRSLNLPLLVEDELLLELPLVPRHEECPEPLPLKPADLVAEESPPNPFAVLASLKRGKLPN